MNARPVKPLLVRLIWCSILLVSVPVLYVASYLLLVFATGAGWVSVKTCTTLEGSVYHLMTDPMKNDPGPLTRPLLDAAGWAYQTGLALR